MLNMYSALWKEPFAGASGITITLAPSYPNSEKLPIP